MSLPTILIVDDDPDFREFVRIVLESQAYQVVEAATAPTGLSAAQQHRPSLILLDAMMSYELTGIGLARTLRQDADLASIPLILISSVLTEDEDRFMSPGERQMVDRFLVKPVSPDVLLLEIAELLKPQAVPGGPAAPE